MLTNISQQGDGDSDGEDKQDVGGECGQEGVADAGGVINQADEDEPMPDDLGRSASILHSELVDQMPNWPKEFPAELLHPSNPLPSTSARPNQPLGFLTLGLYYIVMALSARLSQRSEPQTLSSRALGLCFNSAYHSNLRQLPHPPS